MIEVKTKISQKRKQTVVRTEDDLQAKFGKSNNPIVKALLKARLEHLQKHGRYFTDVEVQKYLNRR